MEHRSYFARVEFDQKDSIFVGRVIGIRDGINFHGQSVDELNTAFIESVDDYLDACEQLGQKPEKPYSGKISLRVSPEIHAAAASAAEAKGDSLNHWIQATLEEKINTVG